MLFLFPRSFSVYFHTFRWNDVSDRLLVVGGRDGLKTLNSMECLDLETGHWASLSPMTTHRHGLGVAVLGGPLYVVGGHDGWSYLNTVER